MKTKKLGDYNYAISDNGKDIGLVSICRSSKRVAWYQVQLPSGEVLKEDTSVRKAALAAMSAANIQQA